MAQKDVAITVFGPTASGKTGMSIGLANTFNGSIINADSRQVYKRMPIITAMPSDEEFAAAEHRLFNFLEPDEPFDVNQYIELATHEAGDLWRQGKVPIFVGGTGFYLQGLEEGISPIPVSDPSIREALMAEVEKVGIEQLHQKLQQVDPKLAETLHATDTQRVLRGLEVFEATGKPLSQWQKQPKAGALDCRFIKIAIIPPREVLYERIHKRFDIMLEEGLVDEMKALKAKGYSPNLSSMTSLGVQEFFSYLDGNMSFEDACGKTLQYMRNYAKRQCTWLRNQYNADIVLEKGDAQTACAAVEKLL